MIKNVLNDKKMTFSWEVLGVTLSETRTLTQLEDRFPIQLGPCFFEDSYGD